MLSKKARATDAAVYGCPKEMKCASLDNLSTMVSMTDLPPTFGNASMKSIEMSFHTNDGTGSGWRRPTRCRCSDFLRWQTVQRRTNSRTGWSACAL